MPKEILSGSGHIILDQALADIKGEGKLLSQRGNSQDGREMKRFFFETTMELAEQNKES